MNAGRRLLLVSLLVVSAVSAAVAGDTGVIASSYGTGTITKFGWVKGTPYVQSIPATEGGFPTSLIVNMGIDCGRIYNIDAQATTVMSFTIYSHLKIETSVRTIFDQDLPGVKQDGLDSGCQVTFPINRAIGAVQKGETLKFTLTITAIKRFDPTMGVPVDDGSVQYVAVLKDNLRFQVKTSPSIIMTATPPVGGSILWEDGTTCGTQCSQSQNSGARHAFTAQPAAGYQFVSWGNPCMGQPATCNVAATVGMPLSPIFGVPLTITPSSNGTVSCTVGCNLRCGYGGTACSAVLPIGTAVTLSTSPKTGMLWQGWSGDCSGIERGCALTMNSAKTVIGRFGSGATF
jgi:hypothetical protein